MYLTGPRLTNLSLLDASHCTLYSPGPPNRLLQQGLESKKMAARSIKFIIGSLTQQQQAAMMPKLKRPHMYRLGQRAAQWTAAGLGLHLVLMRGVRVLLQLQQAALTHQREVALYVCVFICICECVRLWARACVCVCVCVSSRGRLSVRPSWFRA